VRTPSTTSWSKVYSSDLVAPTLFWASPGDGATITGCSYNVAVSANDDHAVMHIDLYLDNHANPVSTKACDDVSYSCTLIYSWSTTKGTHSASFVEYDWLGNVSTLTTNFTVS
jgi:Bacterial Ig domain